MPRKNGPSSADFGPTDELVPLFRQLLAAIDAPGLCVAVIEDEAITELELWTSARWHDEDLAVEVAAFAMEENAPAIILGIRPESPLKARSTLARVADLLSYLQRRGVTVREVILLDESDVALGSDFPTLWLDPEQ